MTCQPTAPGEVSSCLVLATLPTAPFWARRQTRVALESWQLWAEIIDTAELLVSELVTNAVKFTRQDAEDSAPISLMLRYLAGRLIIEVSDPDPNPPVFTEPGSDSDGGRGLMLVQALSKEWSYYRPPAGGKVVYCVISA